MISKENIPLHVAVTMDGNGRWAQMRKLPRTSGHNEGLKVAKNIVQAACEYGVKYLTLYVFSTENWKRAEQEVGFLMNLIHTHLKGELNFYRQNKIKINHIGNLAELPKNIQKDIEDCMNDTKDFDRMTVNLAINYGGQNEIIRGINALFQKAKKDGIENLQIDEKSFTDFLDLKGQPPVDLLIRTGGEERLSNFLIYHVAYAEFIYTKTLWPDYTKEEFYKHIEEFKNRNRRFGAEK